ncbi:VWA domain-containing protein [Nocardioides sp. GXZ039]|uniref:VWA domain-containing protein n=1 Tax=Nocardioides sp. GXZ039 TaxID=3136018 RepID=UPI0030F48367
MTSRARLLVLPVPLLVLTIGLAACGGDGADPGKEHEGSAAGASRGWVGGEPDWSGDSSGDDLDRAEGVTPSMAPDAVPPGPPGPPGTPGPSDGPLRAGNVDDNAAYPAYLRYLDRIGDLGERLRPFDARGRVLVTVTGSDGRPAAGEEVVVSADGDEVATLRTTADGTARFLPGVYGAPVDGRFTVRAGDAETEVEAGEKAALQVARTGGADDAVPLDILFLLDATGSMGDEIDQLKTSIDSVAERVDRLDGNPDVRFAMTLYRDRGDTFVTSTYDFTDDVEEFRSALSKVKADGGGDYPEALEEGLAEALSEPSWRPSGEAVQLVFLVGDAPPQTGRDLQKTYPDSAREAISRGIKIFPVASSESDDAAEAVFRQLAQATGARFVFLSYGAGGAATGEHSDIDRTDYEELSLDDLIVRLTAEELAALTGDPGVVPDPDPTTPPTQ